MKDSASHHVSDVEDREDIDAHDDESHLTKELLLESKALSARSRQMNSMDRSSLYTQNVRRSEQRRPSVHQKVRGSFELASGILHGKMHLASELYQSTAARHSDPWQVSVGEEAYDAAGYSGDEEGPPGQQRLADDMPMVQAQPLPTTTPRAKGGRGRRVSIFMVSHHRLHKYTWVLQFNPMPST